jgi:Nif11 domain
MAKENAIAFLEKIESDPEFRKSIITARNQLFGVGKTGTAPPDILSALGFNIQDMHEAMYERGTKLTTEQLREITGGAENIPDHELEVIAFVHAYGMNMAQS